MPLEGKGGGKPKQKIHPQIKNSHILSMPSMNSKEATGLKMDR